MLQIGHRTYQLVRAQSGLHVIVDPHAPSHHQHTWRLDAHYVPADDDAGAELEDGWEYWRLSVNPMGFYRTDDWRELTQFAFGESAKADVVTCNSTMENLIHLSRSGNPVRSAPLWEFRFIRREGYLFTCELSGTVTPDPDDKQTMALGDFQMLEELPFATAMMQVPLNAGDPLTAAQAMAAREIGLTETVRSSVRPYNPEAWVSRFSSRGVNSVTLETPWRARA